MRRFEGKVVLVRMADGGLLGCYASLARSLKLVPIADAWTWVELTRIARGIVPGEFEEFWRFRPFRVIQDFREAPEWLRFNDQGSGKGKGTVNV